MILLLLFYYKVIQSLYLLYAYGKAILYIGLFVPNTCTCGIDIKEFVFHLPRSDLHVTSPYNLHSLSSKQLMRRLKLIRSKMLS